MIIYIADQEFLPEDPRSRDFYWCDLLEKQIIRPVTKPEIKKVLEVSGDLFTKSQSILMPIFLNR
jgi:hypothetical protein